MPRGRGLSVGLNSGFEPEKLPDARLQRSKSEILRRRKIEQDKENGSPNLPNSPKGSRVAKETKILSALSPLEVLEKSLAGKDEALSIFSKLKEALEDSPEDLLEIAEEYLNSNEKDTINIANCFLRHICESAAMDANVRLGAANKLYENSTQNDIDPNRMLAINVYKELLSQEISGFMTELPSACQNWLNSGALEAAKRLKEIVLCKDTPRSVRVTCLLDLVDEYSQFPVDAIKKHIEVCLGVVETFAKPGALVALAKKMVDMKDVELKQWAVRFLLDFVKAEKDNLKNIKEPLMILFTKGFKDEVMKLGLDVKSLFQENLSISEMIYQIEWFINLGCKDLIPKEAFDMSVKDDNILDRMFVRSPALYRELKAIFEGTDALAKAEEHSARVMMAHIFSIKSLSDGIDLGGNYEKITYRHAIDSLSRFIEDPDTDPDPDMDWQFVIGMLQQGLDNLYEDAASFIDTIQGVLTKEESDGIVIPVSLNTDGDAHSVAMLLIEGMLIKLNRGYLVRGIEGNNRNSVGLEFYDIKDKSFLDKKYLARLISSGEVNAWNEVNTFSEFFDLIAEGHKKKQTMGNCTWATLKTLILALMMFAKYRKNPSAYNIKTKEGLESLFKDTLPNYKKWSLWDRIDMLSRYNDMPFCKDEMVEKASGKLWPIAKRRYEEFKTPEKLDDLRDLYDEMVVDVPDESA